MPPKPLLVTGSHRSGTTWVGEVLAGSRAYEFAYEPFNPRISASWLRHPVRQPYLYVTASNEHEFPLLREDLAHVFKLRYPIARIVLAGRVRGANGTVSFAKRSLRSSVTGRLHRSSALVKDPLALLSAPWIADTYGAQVLVTVRHPGAFAVSLMDKGWSFDFTDFVTQRALMDGPFAPFADELVVAARESPSLPEQAALMWKTLYSFVRETLVPRPDCVLVRHEDVVADPSGVFASLFERYGVPAPASLETKLPSTTFADASRSSTDFTARWHSKLTPGDLAAMREILGTCADWLYDTGTWPETAAAPPR